MKLINIYGPGTRFGTSVSLNEAIDRFLGADLGRETRWSPPVDVFEDAENVVVVLELPGMKKEEIEVSLHDGVLTFAGERKAEKVEGRELRLGERFVGKFERALTLPVDVEAGKVNAVYKDGVLTVTLPKAERAKPRRIELN